MDAFRIYAAPREVTDLKDCSFYHTMDIPGYGMIKGEFDLRPGVHEYLGHVDFKGKRVLEIGTASGFLCYHMESQGADVVAYDLSEAQTWDVVPFCKYDHRAFAAERRKGIRTINNAWWLGHKAFNSRAKMVYGSVYEIPEAIGQVNIATFCSVLLHVRDPFLVMQKALKLTKDTAIVTEVVPNYYFVQKLLGKFFGPTMRFLPDANVVAPTETWWHISPEVMIKYLAVLGFEKYKITFHSQKQRDIRLKFYTIVAQRTQDIKTN